VAVGLEALNQKQKHDAIQKKKTVGSIIFSALAEVSAVCVSKMFACPALYRISSSWSDSMSLALGCLLVSGVENQGTDKFRQEGTR
jgi:hypothetical protein